MQMTMLTSEALRRIAPSARADIVAALIAAEPEMRAAGITANERRLRHFIAQTACESAGFRHLEEGLSYTAERLHAVWPKRFPTVASARPYARNPEKLANKVYGGRLGNTQSGDGYKYRGGGLIQTTGRDNYRAAGHEHDPETVRTPAGGVAAAIEFWKRNGLNIIADRDDIVAVTRKVNGGENGLAERRNFYRLACKYIVPVSDEVEDGSEGETRAPAPADLALSAGKIKALQEQLLQLGYAQIGRPDGVMGSKTIAAISQFQAENGIEVNGRFDEQTQEHLYEASPRVTNYADPKEKGSKITKHAETMMKGALGLMGATGFSAAADPLSQIEAAKGYLDRIKSVMAPFHAIQEFVTGHVWLVAIAAALAVYLYGRTIAHHDADNHATGKTA
jgi:putative chitinase